MSSGVANFGAIRFRDLQFTQNYRPTLAYAQSKLADMLMGVRLAEVATEQNWNLLSTIAHPGYTRTNLQKVGPNLGRATQRPTLFGGDNFTLLPSQGVQQGAEPLLFAATDPAAEQGAYYGPSRLGLVGPTKKVELPRTTRGVDLAASLWTLAEELTGTSLPTLTQPASA
jgi:hypothetical protein